MPTHYQSSPLPGCPHERKQKKSKVWNLNGTWEKEEESNRSGAQGERRSGGRASVRPLGFVREVDCFLACGQPGRGEESRVVFFFF